MYESTSPVRLSVAERHATWSTEALADEATACTEMLACDTELDDETVEALRWTIAVCERILSVRGGAR